MIYEGMHEDKTGEVYFALRIWDIILQPLYIYYKFVKSYINLYNYALVVVRLMYS